MTARGLTALALTASLGCQRAPVASCADDLGGVWRGPAGRYQLLDSRARLELYPLFAELPAGLPPGVVAAPAVIDLTRAEAALPTGTMTRRYERGARFCRVSTPARLIGCGGARLTLTVIPPPPPVDWERCVADAGAPIELALTR